MKKIYLVATLVSAFLVCSSVWARDIKCRLTVREPNQDMKSEKADLGVLKKEMQDGLELNSKSFKLKVEFAGYKLSHVGQKKEPHEPHTVELTLTSLNGTQAHTMGDISLSPLFLSLIVDGKTANAACM